MTLNQIKEIEETINFYRKNNDEISCDILYGMEKVLNTLNYSIQYDYCTHKWYIGREK